MSFDKPTRNVLAKMVSECRRLLTADIRDQLQRVYGLQPDGTNLPVESLGGHLDERGKQTAEELREWHEHLASTEPGSDTKRRATAFDRLAHETAFTALNRLAALRLCEERGHVIECVRRGTESDGFKLFERLSGGALGSRATTYQAFLERMFDELAVDLGMLFDRRAPQSLVFPSESCLEKVLEVLNRANLVHLWQDDETIGWIYQYFNPKQERDAMRKASTVPRNSRELAVRNQFFTPRYVVEFLTDNTLGRIWYEMRRGETKLREHCRYLVHRPSEIFLEPNQESPKDQNPRQELSQDELLKSPGYIPFRPKKDPRDLKILDPACGSGHFLLYAFNLLELIYEEAWDDRDSPPSQVSGKTLREDYPEPDVLRREVPSLILRHNLCGIEIDPRCSQIAALALWLRAQRSHQKLGLEVGKRPQITRSNIVCAEPMPGELELLEEFVAGLRPPLLRQLVLTVFEKMQLAGEAGSLLRVEQEIRGAISKAKEQWVAGPTPEQLLLLPEARRKQVEQLGLFDVSGITEEAFWSEAEARVLEELLTYARRAANGRGYRRRLFAEDAVEGFAFVDICRNKFDVVLMNPPFGEFSKVWKGEALSQYPLSYNDIFAAFTDRGFQLLAERGLLGAITSRVGFFLSTFSKWRTNFLTANGHLRLVADLGEQVMDEAMVEAAAYCLERTPGTHHAAFFRLLGYREERESLLATAVSSAIAGSSNPHTFWRDLTQTGLLPDSPLVYWISPMNMRKLIAHPAFEPTLGEVKVGLQTGDNPRFVRALWEVPPEAIGNEGRFDAGCALRWAPLVMKGSSQPWYSPITVALNWAGQGAELAAFPKAVLRNTRFYFLPGFSWTRRAVRFVPYAVPKGCIPTVSRYIAFPKAGTEFRSLGLTASNIASAFLRFYGEKFAWPNFLVEDLKLLPCPTLPVELIADLEKAAITEVSRRRRTYQNHEPFQDFVAPWVCFPNSDANSLSIDLSSFLGAELEAEVGAAYGFSTSDAVEVERDLREALGARHRAENRNNGAGDSDEPDADTPISDTARDRAHALISYAVGIVFGRWDIRVGRVPGLAPKLPGPFDPIPVCQPGALVGPGGLPARPEAIVSEEWLRARSSVLSIPKLNRVKPALIAEKEYPVKIAWDGILVDDPSHSGHIAHRVREALFLLLSERATSLEADACDSLGVSDLNEYFRRADGFFADHLAVYTKSSRQAPIYWQLATKSGSYGLWIYYHRLSSDLLYKAVNDYINPKVADTERQFKQIEDALASASGHEATKLRSEFESSRSLFDELQDFKTEILRVAALPYKPNPNDGALMTAAPLWKVFRLTRWRRDLEECWKKLEAGEYDWAHLAQSIWPERVREKCKIDRSLAIAHGLEDLCEVAAADTGAKKRGRRGGKAIESPQTNIEEMETKGSGE